MDLLILAQQAAQQFDPGVGAYQGLISSGPLAAVLGYACWRLWNAYQQAVREQSEFLKGLIQTAKGSSSHDDLEPPK